MQPSEQVDAASALAGPARRPVGGAFATVCGWHLAAVVGFVGWVLTRPARVSTGGELSFTTSRWAIALLLGTLLVAPGLSISFALACGLMVVMRRWGGEAAW